MKHFLGLKLLRFAIATTILLQLLLPKKHYFTRLPKHASVYVQLIPKYAGTFTSTVLQFLCRIDLSAKNQDILTQLLKGGDHRTHFRELHTFNGTFPWEEDSMHSKHQHMFSKWNSSDLLRLGIVVTAGEGAAPSSLGFTAAPSGALVMSWKSSKIVPAESCKQVCSKKMCRYVQIHMHGKTLSPKCWNLDH